MLCNCISIKNLFNNVNTLYFVLLILTLLWIFTDVDKNHMIGEIKVALKKEMKTEGEQLVLEILQCRNITYKFKSPDHLPGNGGFTKKPTSLPQDP